MNAGPQYHGGDPCDPPPSGTPHILKITHKVHTTYKYISTVVKYIHISPRCCCQNYSKHGLLYNKLIIVFLFLPKGSCSNECGSNIYREVIFSTIITITSLRNFVERTGEVSLHCKG